MSISPDGQICLLIEHAKPSDCGAYKCIISNTSGEAAMVCAVAVKPEPRAPSFVRPFNDATVIVGEPLCLEGQIIGFPVPEVKWQKDGIPLRPSEAVNFIMQPDGVIGIK